MTIPVETLAAALAGATHRGGPSWRALGRRARHVTLGLVDEGMRSGAVVTIKGGEAGPDRTVAELAVMAAGGATTADDGGERILDADADLDELVARGAAVDRAAPDRFEELVSSVTCDDVATVAAGYRLTHGNLLWAVRSLVRWLPAACRNAGEATPDDRIAVHADPAEVASRVCGPYLAAVLGAETGTPPTVVFADALWWDALAVRVSTEGSRRALRVARARVADDPLTTVERATLGVAGRRMRILRQQLGLDRCRVFVCLGPLPGAGTRRELAAAGIHVTGSWGHPGCAGIAAVGDPPCPLPGLTIGIDDDGLIAVRGASVAADPGGDGWLRTGQPGRLDERGALHTS